MAADETPDKTCATEREIRALLAWYPQMWRGKREEEFVGVWMDVLAQRGRSRLSWGDRLHLIGCGLSARVEYALDPATRRARARAALLVQSLLGVMAVAALVFGETGPRLHHATADPFPPPRLGMGFGPVLWALWLLPFVLAMAGKAQKSRLAVLGALALTWPLLAVGARLDFSRPPQFVMGAVTVAGLLALIADPPTAVRSRRTGLGAFVMLGIVLAALQPFRTLNLAVGVFYRSVLPMVAIEIAVVVTATVVLLFLAGIVNRRLGAWAWPAAAMLPFLWMVAVARPWAGAGSGWRYTVGIGAQALAIVVAAAVAGAAIRRRARLHDVRPG